MKLVSEGHDMEDGVSRQVPPEVVRAQFLQTGDSVLVSEEEEGLHRGAVEENTATVDELQEQFKCVNAFWYLLEDIQVRSKI